jgi:F-type H+-transporting ATPase subunit b
MFLATSLLSTATATTTSKGGGGIVIDADLTFLWSIGIFLVLIVVLKPVLFDPMLKLFEERERRIDGAKLAARKLDEAAAKALTTYETEMKKARSAGNADRETQRAEGLKAEAEIVDNVRKTTTETVDVGRRSIQEEAAAARAALKGEANILAGALASRVLGREVTG